MKSNYERLIEIIKAEDAGETIEYFSERDVLWYKKTKHQDFCLNKKYRIVREPLNFWIIMADNHCMSDLFIDKEEAVEVMNERWINCKVVHLQEVV